MKKQGLRILMAAVLCGLCMAACSKEEVQNNVLAEPQVTASAGTGLIDGSSQQAGDTLAGYQFIPLEQYLLGEWRLDPRYVTVSGDMDHGWTRFHDTYEMHVPGEEPACGNTEEGIVFDTAGNIIYRVTGEEDFATAYAVSDSIVIQTVYPGEAELRAVRCFQISADSMAIYGYVPKCDYLCMVQAYLFLRVRE